jgi:hypothetical protein
MVVCEALRCCILGGIEPKSRALNAECPLSAARRDAKLALISQKTKLAEAASLVGLMLGTGLSSDVEPFIGT